MREITIKIAAELAHKIKSDLQRSHEFAFERIGFVIGRNKILSEKEELICISEYFPVKDEHYIKDDSVGARIDENAIRFAMQLALDKKCSVFHIHMHEDYGTPDFSLIDLDEIPNVVQALVNASPKNIHGAMLLNTDGVNVLLYKGDNVLKKAVIVGNPMVFNRLYYEKTAFDESRYDRQSFLGNWSQNILSTVRVGIVGLGGGGSHIAQQLAHLGVLNYVIFDDDYVSKTNLNRLVGATIEDVKQRRQKTFITKRLIKNLQPDAHVEPINKKWQDEVNLLHSCDIVVGGVDTFANRRDLELDCRRYLIPYIDIGMDVRILEEEPPRMYGQVILSMPGNPCMKCMGYLTEENLALEAAKYGDAGPKPQVVWANGILASAAVGVFVGLLTGWSGESEPAIYEEYDGNKNTLNKSYKLNFLDKGECNHFPLKECGPPIWK